MIARQIGQYEVVAKLGEGGMGEVYRARDTRLLRDVALKILPEAFASDPERSARFAREARTLASLNHPHIAQIYGVEESVAPTSTGAQRSDLESRHISALVMELVEGEDLNTRIRRGPIPYDDAIAMARQIGEALAAAHDQGIIHRDLKPANIKVRDDGTIKVLDFGLAKALEPAIADGTGSVGSLANSPTITSPAGLTVGGVILGSAAYMAPEQAKGRLVDKRADIWAFGCVLYEMLTGRRAFPGDDVTDTLAAVLRSDVDWVGVPPSVVRLLKKCLAKDPRSRLHDIADVWDLIDEPVTAAAATPAIQWIPWALCGLLLVSTTVLAIPYFARQPRPSVVSFQIAAPPGHEFSFNLSLSPDGRRLAFSAIDDKRVAHLWLRDFASTEARRLPGTGGVRAVFWSPDSRYLAFAAVTALKKIDVTSGSQQTIATVSPTSGSGCWGGDDVILFGSRGGEGIQRVSGAGGTPVPLTAVDSARGEISHAFPSLLPDGRHFLYYRQSARPGVAGIYLRSVDKSPGEQDTQPLTATNYGPYILVNAASGTRLLFMREQTLLSQAFDTSRRVLSGEPVAIAEGLGSSGSLGFFTASDEVLVTRSGPAAAPNAFQPTWIDRTGRTLTTVGEPGRFGAGPYALALSPDGRLAAVPMTAPQTAETDLWLLELARGILTRFTAREPSDSAPVWSPDGTRLAFRSAQGYGDIYVKSVNSTAGEVALISSPETEYPSDWSPDGRFLLFFKRPNNLDDLWAFRLAEPKEATPLLETPFIEQGARFSPDGRWIGYDSDESGGREIYVRPFEVSADDKPRVGAAWRVSTNGGEQIRWRRDGKELFYRDGAGAIVSVNVVAKGRALETGIPKRLFMPVPGVPSWDVTADGQRFLLLIPAAQSRFDPLTVVLNWQQQR